jgi:multidrug efflux pump subunit AcrA (membrane-fusion protein)
MQSMTKSDYDAAKENLDVSQATVREARPLSAIVRPKDDPAGYALFVVDVRDGKEVARLRHIKVGPIYGDMIAVPAGVGLGERVITTGATRLGDGEPLRVVP